MPTEGLMTKTLAICCLAAIIAALSIVIPVLGHRLNNAFEPQAGLKRKQSFERRKEDCHHSAPSITAMLETPAAD